jgi:hypothetical protein
MKKPDNAIVVKANWRDNPWFPAVLEEEQHQLYPERYPHIVFRPRPTLRKSRSMSVRRCGWRLHP